MRVVERVLFDSNVMMIFVMIFIDLGPWIEGGSSERSTICMSCFLNFNQWARGAEIRATYESSEAVSVINYRGNHFLL